MTDDTLFSAIISETISHIGISNPSSGKIYKYLINKGYDSGLASDVVSELISRGYISELFDSSLPYGFDINDETMRNSALKLAKQRGFTFELAQKELKNR